MFQHLQTTHRLVGLMLAVAATLVLAACGASGPAVTQGSLTQEDAQAYSQFATQSVAMQMDLLQNPASLVDLTGSGTLALHGIAPQQECVTEVGTGIDSDSDGIPNSGTWTYACTEATDGFTARGTVTLADDNDADPNSGYLLTISDDFGFSYGSGPDSFSFGFSGFVDVGANANVYTADIDLTFEFASGSESASFSLDYVQTFTADSGDGDTDPFNNGTLSFSGSIAVSSESGSTLEEYNLTVETTTPLTISSTCTDGNVESGAVVYSDSEGNALTVSFSSCTASTTYVGS